MLGATASSEISETYRFRDSLCKRPVFVIVHVNAFQHISNKWIHGGLSNVIGAEPTFAERIQINIGEELNRRHVWLK